MLQSIKFYDFGFAIVIVSFHDLVFVVVAVVVWIDLLIALQFHKKQQQQQQREKKNICNKYVNNQANAQQPIIMSN